MNKAIVRFFNGPVMLCLAGGLSLFLAGCCTPQPKEKPPEQRGWIGGEYKLAKRPVGIFGLPGDISAFPASLPCAQKAGLLITALSSNTPVRLAGLREGDLILELDHSPVTSLRDFHRQIDRTEPGALLPVKAYRQGVTLDYKVTVGREKFRQSGTFTIMLLPIVRDLDLWPNPGFSLGVLGYQPGPDKRRELGSVEAVYRRNCNPNDKKVFDDGWHAWLGLFDLSSGRTILSQEPIPATPHTVNNDSGKIASGGE